MNVRTVQLAAAAAVQTRGSAHSVHVASSRTSWSHRCDSIRSWSSPPATPKGRRRRRQRGNVCPTLTTTARIPSSSQFLSTPFLQSPEFWRSPKWLEDEGRRWWRRRERESCLSTVLAVEEDTCQQDHTGGRNKWGWRGHTWGWRGHTWRGHSSTAGCRRYGQYVKGVLSRDEGESGRRWRSRSALGSEEEEGGGRKSSSLFFPERQFHVGRRGGGEERGRKGGGEDRGRGGGGEEGGREGREGGRGMPRIRSSVGVVGRSGLESRPRSESGLWERDEDMRGYGGRGEGGYGRDRDGGKRDRLRGEERNWKGSTATTQQQQRRRQGQKVEEEGESREKTRRKKKSLPKPLRPEGPVCYGCGAKLQTVDADVAGYVDEAKYELKKLHHQLKNLMCGRCHALSHGQMIAAVGGHGGYGNGKGFVLAEDLRRQLLGLQHQKVLVVKLVDIIDFNGSFLARVRDLVGANPIILVVTKVDLLPEGTDFAANADWLLAATLRKKLNVISIHLTSAKNGAGIRGVAANIMRERLGRDVYVLGAANVGKSAFISALLDEMARHDIIAANARRFRPVQSAMPGTTLGPIAINAFSSGGDLFDTPGIHLHHRMPAVVDPIDLPLLAPRHRMRPYIVSAPIRSNIPDEPTRQAGHNDKALHSGTLSTDRLSGHSSATAKGVAAGETEQSGVEIATEAVENREAARGAGTAGSKRGLAGWSLFWGGLARIDILKAPPSAKLAFYGATAIRVHVVKTSEADDFYERELGQKLSPPSSRDAGRGWKGLQKTPVLQFTAQAEPRPAGEVAISGLGWFSISGFEEEESPDEDVPPGLQHATAHDSVTAKSEGNLRKAGDRNNTGAVFSLEVRVPKGVEVFPRSPLPVGEFAKDWYEWLDLTSYEGSEDQANKLPELFYPDQQRI